MLAIGVSWPLLAICDPLHNPELQLLFWWKLHSCPRKTRPFSLNRFYWKVNHVTLTGLSTLCNVICSQNTGMNGVKLYSVQFFRKVLDLFWKVGFEMTIWCIPTALIISSYTPVTLYRVCASFSSFDLRNLRKVQFESPCIQEEVKCLICRKKYSWKNAFFIISLQLCYFWIRTDAHLHEPKLWGKFQFHSQHNFDHYRTAKMTKIKLCLL